MKQQLQQLIITAIERLQAKQQFPDDLAVNIQIEHARDKQHGDFACNVAMLLAKPLKSKPRDIAQAIVEEIPASTYVSNIEIAGPGFINFYLNNQAYYEVVKEILAKREQFGLSDLGEGKKILLEFVSANPTGPLHVGHGRGAAYGASLAALLRAAGYKVDKEYYVNDAGRQMNILAASVWLRYLEHCDLSLPFPVNGYKGDYVLDIAAKLKQQYGDQFQCDADAVLEGLPQDETDGGDKEVYIDAVIARMHDLLGVDNFNTVHAFGLQAILDDIRDDLSGFGVTFENWFSERELMSRGAIDHALEVLEKSGYLYEKDGAVWFNAIHFGDEKDRVVKRANGDTTYFASDIAYHLFKFEQGYDEVIDILGADHHGYIARLNAGIKAMGQDPEKFKILLVQFAILYRGKDRVQMSTRSGSFVTLRELRDEVGNDAARFFYVMRKAEQHMDFDLELAKSQSADNPVYYIQYAHARICSVMREVEAKQYQWREVEGLAALDLLAESHEKDLMSTLAKYPEVVEAAAKAYEPHQIAHYLRDLANDFHTYYNAHQFLVDDVRIRNARLCLIQATRNVLTSGLTMLGVSSPETM